MNPEPLIGKLMESSNDEDLFFVTKGNVASAIAWLKRRIIMVNLVYEDETWAEGFERGKQAALDAIDEAFPDIVDRLDNEVKQDKPSLPKGS